MFKINSYLQYRNTPDDKPRVLREGVDYDFIAPAHFFTKDEKFKGDKFFFREDSYEIVKEYTGSPSSYFTTEIAGFGVKMPKLSDCRPLLTVEIDGVEWTEGDVFDWQPYGSYQGELGNPHFFSFYLDEVTKEIKNYRDKTSGYKTKIGSFFDNPAKYSQLLWNCSKEEGWKKIFELLDIKN